MDEEFRKLERLAATGDEDALLALSRARLRAGLPPILQAYTKQLEAAKQEVKLLNQLGSNYLLGMLAEVFSKYFQKYGDVIESILWRLNARYQSHTGRPVDAYGDRVVAWVIEGPYLLLEDSMAQILSEVLPIGQESTNFPRGPQAVSVIEDLRLPGWESVISLKKIQRGFKLATAGVLEGHLDAPVIRDAVKDLILLAPHLEGIRSQISDYLHRIMESTKAELLYFVILSDSFEIYSADQRRLIASMPFDGL